MDEPMMFSRFLNELQPNFIVVDTVSLWNVDADVPESAKTAENRKRTAQILFAEHDFTVVELKSVGMERPSLHGR